MLERGSIRLRQSPGPAPRRRPRLPASGLEPVDPHQSVGLTRALALAAAVALAGCTAAPGAVPASPAPPGPASSSTGFQPETPTARICRPAASTPPPLQVSDPGRVTGTLTGPCYTRGTPPAQLPDPACTPGAYDPKVTAAILCARATRPGCTGRPHPAPTAPPGSNTTRHTPPTASRRAPPPNSTTLLIWILAAPMTRRTCGPKPGRCPTRKMPIESKLHTWVCAASGAEAQEPTGVRAAGHRSRLAHRPAGPRRKLRPASSTDASPSLARPCGGKRAAGTPASAPPPCAPPAATGGSPPHPHPPTSEPAPSVEGRAFPAERGSRYTSTRE